jgi:hypothetical protein
VTDKFEDELVPGQKHLARDIGAGGGQGGFQGKRERRGDGKTQNLAAVKWHGVPPNGRSSVMR